MKIAELNELAERYAEFRRINKTLPTTWIDYIDSKSPATQLKFWAAVDKLDREYWAA